jgi:hypothetical protein
MCCRTEKAGDFTSLRLGSLSCALFALHSIVPCDLARLTTRSRFNQLRPRLGLALRQGNKLLLIARHLVEPSSLPISFRLFDSFS